MEFKALKSASKISSSSSTTGPSIQSRQSSSLSRTSRRRGSDTCPKEPRPATSFVSTRVSHSSGLDVTVDDKLPLDVHRLGAYPKYLRSKRPMTAVGKSDKLKAKPFQFHGACAGVRYEAPKKVAKPRDKVLHSMNHTAGCPPCEGHTSNSSGKKIIWDEALDKICQLEAICSRKKERIAQLEAEVALHESALQQRDVDIQKQMECGIERVSPNSKDKINPEEALVDEQKVKELQQQLLNKSNDFLKCQNHIAELKQKLVESNAKVEQQDLTIFELVEKEAERVTELEVMKQLVKDLEQQLTTLRAELTDKEALVAVLESKVAPMINHEEMDALQQEAKQLRFGNLMLTNEQELDAVIFRIRTQLLGAIERIRKEFDVQMV